jgi:hypothetical protein
MRRGELSSERLPRALVVFEGLVGVLPDVKTSALEALARKRKKWDVAAGYYRLNISTSGGMRDLYWRHHFRVDIVTFIDPNFVSAIRNRMDSRNLLFGDVHYYANPVELSQDLTYDQSILGVLDPNPANTLTYGSRGRYCSPEQLDLLKILI